MNENVPRNEILASRRGTDAMNPEWARRGLSRLFMRRGSCSESLRDAPAEPARMAGAPPAPLKLQEPPAANHPASPVEIKVEHVRWGLALLARHVHARSARLVPSASFARPVVLRRAAWRLGDPNFAIRPRADATAGRNARADRRCSLHKAAVTLEVATSRDKPPKDYPPFCPLTDGSTGRLHRLLRRRPRRVPEDDGVLRFVHARSCPIYVRRGHRRACRDVGHRSRPGHSLVGHGRRHVRVFRDHRPNRDSRPDRDRRPRDAIVVAREDE